jgi:hypothetical protein
VLARGAETYGFVGDVWTTARAAVIEREFLDPSEEARTPQLLLSEPAAPPRGAARGGHSPVPQAGMIQGCSRQAGYDV